MAARSTSELRALSEHVLYEAQMLFLTANRLRAQVDRHGRLPWELEMSTIEAFALNTRVLEFLWHDPSEERRRRFPDDAYAADVFPAGQWAALRPAMEATLEGLWSRAGGEIAHLSYKRTSQPSAVKRWQFDSIAGSIGRAFRVFLEQMDSSLLAAGFAEKLRASWPQYLNYPVAISFPPDQNARSVATQSLQDVGRLRSVADDELIP